MNIEEITNSIKEKLGDEEAGKIADDLASIIINDKSLNETKKLIKKLSSYKGCTKDAKKLYEYLNLDFECVRLWENLYVYSYLIHDQELGIDESVARKDKTIKKEKYAWLGIDEYWIVSPRERSVEVYYLEGTEYKLVGSHILVDDKEDENYNAEIMLTLRSLPTISIILEKIFENIE